MLFNLRSHVDPHQRSDNRPVPPEICMQSRLTRPFPVHRFAILLASVVVGASSAAQQSRAYPAANYDRAVRFLGPNLTRLVVGGTVVPNWLPDERFWYRDS